MPSKIIPIHKTLAKAIDSKQNNYPCEKCDECIYVDIFGTSRDCNPESFKKTVDNYILDFAKFETMDIVKRIKRHDDYLTSRLFNVVSMCKDNATLETVLKTLKGEK